MANNRGSRGKPSWFEHSVTYSQLQDVALMIDVYGPEAYGVHWMLQEFLASQEKYRAKLSLLPGLIRRFNTTAAVMEGVIYQSGMYKIEKNEFFYSPPLKKLLNEFDQKCIEQSKKARIGVKARKLELLEQEQDLKAKLSELDSSEPRLSHSKAVAEPNTIQYIRKENKHSSSNDCKEEEKIFDKKEFKKEYIKKYNNNVNAKILGMCNYTELIVKNGYLFNCFNQKDLKPDAAIKVWEAMYDLYLARRSEGAA